MFHWVKRALEDVSTKTSLKLIDNSRTGMNVDEFLWFPYEVDSVDVKTVEALLKASFEELGVKIEIDERADIVSGDSERGFYLPKTPAKLAYQKYASEPKRERMLRKHGAHMKQSIEKITGCLLICAIVVAYAYAYA